MKTQKTFAVFLFIGYFSTLDSGLAGPYYWDGNAATLPNEMNPPWTLVSSGFGQAFQSSEMSRNVAFLSSTQAVDNVFFELRGQGLEMTNQLSIDAALRMVDGKSFATSNHGSAGIRFTVANGVGGAVWFGPSSVFVAATGDVAGATTNLNTTGDYHSYRIEVEGITNDGPYTVFYDGRAVLTGRLYQSVASFGAEPRIQWGEISRDVHGESHWYSLRHNAAAPFTTLTNPAVQLACSSGSVPVLPPVAAPFLSLTSEGRITNGTSIRYANLRLIFNTDNGIIYEGDAGGFKEIDNAPRRTFVQSDGSEIMLFEFTDLTVNAIDVKVTGSRAAAILATGDVKLIRGARLEVDAAGDLGAPVGSVMDAGFDAPTPLGGGGGRGTASGYSAGEPPFLVPGRLPTSGPGGGGFVSNGQDGFPAQPVRMWKYNGPPTFDFSMLGTLNRPGGAGGGEYTNFSVLRGGGGGGSSSGSGFAGNAGFNGGHGGGALLLSAAGRVFVDSQSSVSVSGQRMIPFLSEIAGGGAGGYLVVQGGRGILNEGALLARGGIGRKIPYTDGNGSTYAWWGSSGDGSGGLIVLKSPVGVTNVGAVVSSGGGGVTDTCTLGLVQAQTPVFVNQPPLLSLPVMSGDQLTFTFPAPRDAIYHVQRNDDLNTTNWITFTNVTGIGFPAIVVTPTPGVGKRFFRVLAD